MKKKSRVSSIINTMGRSFRPIVPVAAVVFALLVVVPPPLAMSAAATSSSTRREVVVDGAGESER